MTPPQRLCCLALKMQLDSLGAPPTCTTRPRGLPSTAQRVVTFNERHQSITNSIGILLGGHPLSPRPAKRARRLPRAWCARACGRRKPGEKRPSREARWSWRGGPQTGCLGHPWRREVDRRRRPLPLQRSARPPRAPPLPPPRTPGRIWPGPSLARRRASLAAAGVGGLLTVKGSQEEGSL